LSAPGHSLTYIGILTAAGDTASAKRGRTLGISGAGIGVGLTVLLPLAVWASTAIGWRGAFLSLAAVMGMARERV
ncbi:MAG: MFS transporter, partial [Acidobacteriota bacterium]|nr:MFS transporter [Acidobacteriota bacterium]